MQNPKNTNRQIHKHRDQHTQTSKLMKKKKKTKDNQVGAYLQLSLLAAFEGKQVDDESFDWRSDAGGNLWLCLPHTDRI